ncbi:fimbria/pilus periplasmic chaperone [Escherichia coli]|nr:fimbria/pilus periplasmic chaperone [Escherichia coli]MDS1619809.1 fimbria/pilus periplasmic chaperone [Escherichia coli]
MWLKRNVERNDNLRATGFAGGTVWCAASLLVVSVGLGVMSVNNSCAAENKKIEMNTQSFSVRLGATRVIYDPASSGAALAVTNPQTYPILVQSQVLTEDMKGKAPFVVTPPLFRLDGQQQSRLRIVRTGGNFAEDRESIQWLCVKGIPPKADDQWAKDKDGKSAVSDKVSLNIQMSINSCIKLFVRPGSIKGHPDDVASSLTWHKQGQRVNAVNDTPFYMNLVALKVDGHAIGNVHYIPPFSSYSYELPAGTARNVTWQVINDYGGMSKEYHAEIKK